MELAPVEWALIGFEGGEFKGEVLDELKRLEADEIIRVLDIVAIRKSEAGDVQSFKLGVGDDGSPLAALSAAMQGLFTDEDIMEAGETLAPGTAAALLAIEDTWARRLQEAIGRAGGQLLGNERIPWDVVDEEIARYQAGPGRLIPIPSEYMNRLAGRSARSSPKEQAHARTTQRRRASGRRRRRRRPRPAPSGAEVRGPGCRAAAAAGRAGSLQYAPAPAPAPAPVYAAPAPAPAPAAPAAPAGGDLTSQLQQLADLKAQGILSDEEFAEAKAKLLAP